jgi:hypothetical protein
MLAALIDRLWVLGQKRIVVIDNGSTYEPLLKYYDEIGKRGTEILKMKENFGHTVLSHLFADRNFVARYNLDRTAYIITDCDIVPIEQCPPDFVLKFEEVLKKYKVHKVGFGLKIDDLPDTFRAKQKVINWESQFWQNQIYDQEMGVDLYPAAIDTTFAFCMPNGSPGWTNKSIRMGHPYLARHLSWYIDSDNLSKEDLNYIATADKRETHFPERYREIK